MSQTEIMQEPAWKLEMILSEINGLLHACVTCKPDQREEAREDVKFYNRIKEEILSELDRRGGC